MVRIVDYLELLKYGAVCGIGAFLVSGINLILWLTHWKGGGK